LLPNLFMPQAARSPMRDDARATAGAGCSGGRGDGVAAEAAVSGGGMCRGGLFYAVGCVMCDLASRTGWAQFMIGTAPSISEFQTSAPSTPPCEVPRCS
jgi:hypothetical protein